MKKLFAIAVAGAMSAGVVSGQDYPNKPIRIVTATPGGGSDFMARQIARGIAGPLSQPVIIDNRPSVLGVEVAAKAPPDGYTFLVSGSSFWVTPMLRKTPYDAVKDFSPITQIAQEVCVVSVHPSLPVKSIKELISLAKARPGELNYASGVGDGSTSQIAGELFKSMAGLNILHIPYKGSGQALTDLLAGEVQMMFPTAGAVISFVKAGRLRALAVTSLQPSALFPGVATVAAAGLPGYEAIGVTGMYAPAKTPATIVARLNQEVVLVLNRAEVKEAFFNSGIEVISGSPGELAAKMKSHIDSIGKVIKDAGIKASN